MNDTATERRQTIYRLGTVERRSGIDPQLQPHPRRGDVTSELKEGTKLYPADPRWGDSYAKYVEEFREIFFK